MNIPNTKPGDWLVLEKRPDGSIYYGYVMQMQEPERCYVAVNEHLGAARREFILRDGQWSFARPNPDGTRLPREWSTFLAQGPPTQFDSIGGRLPPPQTR